MKKFTLVIISLCCIHYTTFSQAGQWVWLHGDSTFNSQGIYGIKGVPQASNNPPALFEPCEWTDTTGRFWMYGGVDTNGVSGVHNDLWMYNPASNEWTWMKGRQTLNDHGHYGVKGVPDSANYPPGLGYAPASWTDHNGNFWMFGGWIDSTYADLWEYNISTNEWTWMKGPGTGNPPGHYGTQGVPSLNDYPPPRYECQANWTDNNGNLWLFGGSTVGGGMYNDLWKYDVVTNIWTWVKGSGLLSQPGLWGTKGVEANNNVPSARRSYSHWIDSGGNLWMFGGYGLDSLGSIWTLGDMWRYDIPKNEWTWMNGQNIGSFSNQGVYGVKCIMDPGNQPPPRNQNMAVWTDAKENFWMYGGLIQIFALSLNYSLSDLWMYCPSSNEWTWVNGDSVVGSPASAIWGTLGVYSPTNTPGGRSGCPSWIDPIGHLYQFGGRRDSAGLLNIELFNALWAYDIDTTCVKACGITGIKDIKADDPQITIYPNPAGKQLYINASSYIHGTVIISVLNMLGQETMPPTPLQKRGEGASLDVSALPAGMYFIQLKTESASVVKKFVKE